MTTSRSATWFRRVTWIGILANLALAVPTLVAPSLVMAAMGLPPASPLVWVRFAALLVILLSLFYVPAAIDLDRYRATAWLSVIARLAGVAFFTPQATYRMFGLFDLAFFVPQLILLALAVRHGPAMVGAPAGGRISS